MLAGEPGPLDASVARQAIGIVLREYGDIDAAIGELRIARHLARRAGSTSREADVLATLGLTLVFAGRTRSGRNTLDAAVRQSTGHLRVRALLRRGGALLLIGHHPEALEDLNSAVVALRMADDQIWEARALQAGRSATCHPVRRDAPSPTCDEPRTCSPRTGRNWSQRRPL